MAKAKVEGISTAELERLCKQKQFSSLYLFFGDEDFLISEGVDALIEHAVDKATASFNLDILYGSDIEARQIINIASSYPMMADRRVVVVKEFEKVSNKEQLIPYFEKPSSSTSLAIVAAKTDFRQKVFDVLKKNATLVSCKSPYDNEMPEWIQSRVKKLGKTIKSDATVMLHARTGNSLRIVQSELDKLFIYVGEKKEITPEDVEEVVGMSKLYNIFELQKALGSGNIGRIMEIMEHMLDAGESAIGMVVMLTKYFQKVLLYHEFSPKRFDEFSFSNKIGVSPSFLKDYAEAARNYSRADIDLCFRHLLEADEALKFSADEKLTMTLLLYKIVRKVNVVENMAI